YPQQAFPYNNLVRTNQKQDKTQGEYEITDTGIFKDNRYFDVFIEYAKNSPSDLLIKITAHNRGPEAAFVDLLPTLWFRNTWAWRGEKKRPQIRIEHEDEMRRVIADHPGFETCRLYFEEKGDQGPDLL